MHEDAVGLFQLVGLAEQTGQIVVINGVVRVQLDRFAEEEEGLGELILLMIVVALLKIVAGILFKKDDFM